MSFCNCKSIGTEIRSWWPGDGDKRRGMTTKVKEGTLWSSTLIVVVITYLHDHTCLSKLRTGASLVVRWLRICLPMQGTQVRALVWEDPTCRRATRPVRQLLSLRVWSLCSATREAAIVRGPCTTMKSGPRLPQLDKALAQKQRPNTAKIK